MTTPFRPSAADLARIGADVAPISNIQNKLVDNHPRLKVPDRVAHQYQIAGGKALEQLLDQMRAGGRIAFPNGVEPAPRKRSKIRIRSYDAIASPKHFARLNRAVEEARLQVPIAAVYSLAQAAKAHERIKRGHVLGRIVLRIRR